MKVSKVIVFSIVSLISVTGFAGSEQGGKKEKIGTTITYKQDRTTTKPVPQRKNKWKGRHQRKVNGLKDRTVDLLLVGDSITEQWEKAKASKVWRRSYKDYKSYNIGFSGDRTENVLWRLQNGEVDGISPKVVVVMIGTNNTGGGNNAAEDTAYGIKAILEELRSRLPKSKILLLAIFPRGETKDDEKRKINEDVNKIIKAYGDGEFIHYLNINDKFLEKDGKIKKGAMRGDFLHLSKGGYETWAAAMKPSIEKLMGDSVVP